MCIARLPHFVSPPLLPHFSSPSHPSPLIPPSFPLFLLAPQRLPVMAEDLIDYNLPYGRGSSLVGSKVRELIAVNLQSGKVGVS